jgi:hypothetical protein
MEGVHGYRRSAFGSLAFWLTTLAVFAAAVITWAAFAHRLATAVPVSHIDVPEPNAVVGRDRGYQSRTLLARDLERRGQSYSVWAGRHPGAAALLSGLARGRRH